MLLNLDTDQDIDFLKWEAALQTKDQKFTHSAAQKLKEIMLDDQIQAQDFIEEFNKILASNDNLNWKTLAYFVDIKNRFIDQLVQVSWLQIGIILLIVTFFFFLNKKFKLKKLVQILYALSGNIIERFAALFGYFVPLVVVYANYLIALLPSYPYLNLILPNFMKLAVYLYVQRPLYINFGYFFAIVFLCIQYKLPKPRFIRFHLVRGIMLLAFQGIPEMIFQLLQFSDVISNTQRINTALFLFVLNLFWILPCLVQAITHTYPKSSFMRDAIEIQLGRDNNEDFKWWDR